MVTRTVSAVGIALAAVAFAQAAISTEILRVEVSTGVGLSDTLVVTSDKLMPGPASGGLYTLASDPDHLGSYEFMDGGTSLATLGSANLLFVDDPVFGPRISMNYQITAASADITVRVNSAEVSFAALPAVSAALRATAGFSLSDFNDGVQAELESLNPSAWLGIHHTYYNGDDVAGVEFSDLLPGLSASSGGSISTSDSRPNGGSGGYENVNAPVSSLYVVNEFTLTGMDYMSGNNTYYALPEPAAAVMLSVGVLFVIRRR